MNGLFNFAVFIGVFVGFLFALNWLFGVAERAIAKRRERKADSSEPIQHKIDSRLPASSHMELSLKIITISTALFIAYLWSGGVFLLTSQERYVFKHNKITGTTQVLYEGEWRKIKTGEDLK